MILTLGPPPKPTRKVKGRVSSGLWQRSNASPVASLPPSRGQISSRASSWRRRRARRRSAPSGFAVQPRATSEAECASRKRCTGPPNSDADRSRCPAEITVPRESRVGCLNPNGRAVGGGRVRGDARCLGQPGRPSPPPSSHPSFEPMRCQVAPSWRTFPRTAACSERLRSGGLRDPEVQRGVDGPSPEVRRGRGRRSA